MFRTERLNVETTTPRDGMAKKPGRFSFFNAAVFGRSQAHVKRLRNALAEEKERGEKLTVELNQELSRKQETIDSLERRMSYDGSRNAAEELRCDNLNVRIYRQRSQCPYGFPVPRILCAALTTKFFTRPPNGRRSSRVPSTMTNNRNVLSQTNNVGKLNLEQTNTYDSQCGATFELPDLSQLKVNSSVIFILPPHAR